MQLGKKSKTSDLFDRVRGDLGPSQAEETEPALSNSRSVPVPDFAHSAPESTSVERDDIEITIAESISAKISREGSLKSFNVKGDLQLYISDSSLTKVKLNLVANPTHHATFRTHPNVDKGVFTNSKTIQLRDNSKGFPPKNSVGVLRWSASAPAQSNDVLPLNFTVWVNRGTGDSWTITVEYELTGTSTLRDVAVTIPYASSEPAVSSFDANYEISGDSLEWVIGTIDESNANGNFDFEAQAEDEGEFFPMSVRFTKDKPFVDVDVGVFFFPYFFASNFLPFFLLQPHSLLFFSNFLPFLLFQPLSPSLLATHKLSILKTLTNLNSQITLLSRYQPSSFWTVAKN